MFIPIPGTVCEINVGTLSVFSRRMRNKCPLQGSIMVIDATVVHTPLPYLFTGEQENKRTVNGVMAF